MHETWVSLYHSIMTLGAIHKLRHTKFMIFWPRPCHRWSHFWDTPYKVWRHRFCILHLEIIKLKQQKCNITKFRILPLVTQCHTSSTPSAHLNLWRILWMTPYIPAYKNKLVICRFRTKYQMVCKHTLSYMYIRNVRTWLKNQVLTGAYTKIHNHNAQ